MRGTLTRIELERARAGIIPAHAGNTQGTRTRAERRRDHPRACGEHAIVSLYAAGNEGSSPRMRGTLARRIEIVNLMGIIPAHAGNTAGTGTET